MVSKARILWVTPKWPLPLSDGSRQATFSLLSEVTKSDFTIDLAAFVDEAIDTKDQELARSILGVSKIFIIPKACAPGQVSRIVNFLLSSLSASRLPFTFIPYQSQQIESLLRISNIDDSPWTHVVFDGLHTAVSFIEKGRRKLLQHAKFVYRAHNVESLLWEQVAEGSSFYLKCLLSKQGSKVIRTEGEIIKCCDLLAPVSSDDLEQLKSRYQVNRTVVVPIGLSFEVDSELKISRLSNNSLSLLFVGSALWRPNREGLLWFLREVWPHVCALRPDISLIIAGRGTDCLGSELVDLPNLKILGEVDQVEPLYAQAHAAIVPIFSGSGTRVKAIEAGRYSRPCISTALGVSGLPLEAEKSYLRAEDKEDWIRILAAVKTSELKKLGITAYEILRNDFDKVKIAETFLEKLKELT